MPKSPKTGTEPPLAPSATPDVPGPMPATAKAAWTPPRNGEGKGRSHDQHPGEPALPGIALAPPGIVPESDVRVHTPAAAAPLREHGHVNEGLGELPWAYGDARLIGLVRDPTTLFVYWDFSQQQIEQAFAGLGPAHAVLKLWNTRAGNGDLVRRDGRLPRVARMVRARSAGRRRAARRDVGDRRAGRAADPRGAPGAPATGGAFRSAGGLLPAIAARPVDRAPASPAAVRSTTAARPPPAGSAGCSRAASAAPAWAGRTARAPARSCPGA